MHRMSISHFRRWYSQSGTPSQTVKDDYNPETEQYTLTISQRTPATPDQAEKQPLHIPFAIELYDNEGKVIPLQKGGHPVNSVLNVTGRNRPLSLIMSTSSRCLRCCANSLRQ